MLIVASMNHPTQHSSLGNTSENAQQSPLPTPARKFSLILNSPKENLDINYKILMQQQQQRVLQSQIHSQLQQQYSLNQDSLFKTNTNNNLIFPMSPPPTSQQSINMNSFYSLPAPAYYQNTNNSYNPNLYNDSYKQTRSGSIRVVNNPLVGINEQNNNPHENSPNKNVS